MCKKHLHTKWLVPKCLLNFDGLMLLMAAQNTLWLTPIEFTLVACESEFSVA